MIEFKGFPERIKKYTPIPNVVFSSLLPQITDITELKALFYFFEILYPKKGNVRFVSHQELLGHFNRASDFQGQPQSFPEILQQSLKALVDKGVLLHLALNDNGIIEDVYFLNNETNRLVIERIRNGDMVLPGLKPESPVPICMEELPDIFTLYEQNIGMLTPLIAEELKEARANYPETWINDAIKEAAALNRRSWRYIARILENWSIEGKDNGTYRGYPKKNTDPDKYIRGKYGHMVQR